MSRIHSLLFALFLLGAAPAFAQDTTIDAMTEKPTDIVGGDQFEVDDGLGNSWKSNFTSAWTEYFQALAQALDHDSFTNFVADEHVPHSSVTLTAGDGLDGGGTIDANRTFSLDLKAGSGLEIDSTELAFLETCRLSDGSIPKVSGGNWTCGSDNMGVGGTPVAVDLGNNAVDDIADLDRINTANDTNGIFSESPTDELLIDLSLNWPGADVANSGDSATSFFSSGEIEDDRIPAILTLTGSTISDSLLQLKAGTPALEGEIRWDDANKRINVADSAFANYNFYAGAHTVDTNTNAETLCANDLFLNGDGTCDDLAATFLAQADAITELCVNAPLDDVIGTADDRALWSYNAAVTITEVYCTYTGTGTTVATFALEDSDGNAMTHTAPTCTAMGTEPTEQAVTAANGLIAREYLRVDVTNTPAPTTDDYILTFCYTVD